jgi:hypothetical protein
LCWITTVVGAGVFASAEDSLREWRAAVGPAASGAELSPCAAGITARLLAPCLETGFLANVLQGREPGELIREYYRLRRRARDLTGSADVGAGSSPFDVGRVHDGFLDWYAARHDDAPEATTEAMSTILGEWGPHENLDERSFHACSPHRIEMAAHLIREGYFAATPTRRSGCCRSGRSGARANRARRKATKLTPGRGVGRSWCSEDVDVDGGFVSAPVDVGASGLVFGDRAFDDAGTDAQTPVG